MTTKILSVLITSTRPLIMHADQLANPVRPETKAHKQLTAVRKKTEEDQLAIMRSEWFSSLYYNAIDGVHMPGQNLEACLKDGAKLLKLGRQISEGVSVHDDAPPLIYDGPKTPDKLFLDPAFVDVRSVKVQQARIMRCRPFFLKWSIKFNLAFEDDVIDAKQIRTALDFAGARRGLCDYRPRFGRFTVTTFELAS